MTLDAQMRDLARRAAARATAEHVARALEAVGIRSLLLKGAALVLDVYPEDVPRALSDVDVLVEPEQFTRAVEVLTAHGYTKAFSEPHAMSRTLLGPASPLHVDLHGALYSRGLFDMPAAALFARALRIEGLDIDLLRPHGLDLIAHAIGHFAKTRPPPKVDVLGRDIACVIARDRLSITDVASHLERAGLARAARYALPRITEPEARVHARAILDALPGDVSGRIAVDIARRTEATALESVPSVLSRHVLNATLARGAVSFGYHVLDALQRRARERFSRRP